MKDTLGDRIKEQYEDRTRYHLPRRTYTIIRVDGKAFHTFTKGCKKPYDRDLMTVMDLTAIKMCEQIQGVKFAYVQSDEISLLLTDFETPTTCLWFDGNIQKMASVAASLATAAFNRANGDHGYLRSKDAHFDARVFTIPDQLEVENYFIWRQQDATRNSLQMAARALYSHKQLDGKGSEELHELLHAKGVNWNNYTSGEKRGRIIKKVQYVSQVASRDEKGKIDPDSGPTFVERNKWVSFDGAKPTTETPIFTQNRIFLREMIPTIEGFIPKTHNGGASIYDCG